MSDFFRTYKDHPSQENLLNPLRGIQDFVHNLCFQVLQHSQDAEDASQRVLLKILEVLPRVSEEEHFRSLLARIAIQISLNAAEARHTRRKHETEKSVTTSLVQVAPPEDLRADLFRAISGLDAPVQDLLIGRYLEGKPLEVLAASRHCSTTTVWNQVEKGKDALRRALTGTGLAASIAAMQSMLEASVYTPAPRDLIERVVIEKSARVATVAKSSPTQFKGGDPIAAPAGLSAGPLAAVTLFLLAFAGGLIVLLSRRGASGEPPLERWPVSVGPHRESHGEDALPLVATGESAPDRNTELWSSLNLLRDQIRKARAKPYGDPQAPELYRIVKESWREIYPQAMTRLNAYMAFLREPGSADMLQDLLGLLFGYELWSGGCFRPQAGEPPAAVLERLYELLSSGTLKERKALLQYASIFDSGDQWKSYVWRAVRQDLISQEAPEALALMIDAAYHNSQDSQYLRDKLEQELNLLRDVWNRSHDKTVRQECLSVLSLMSGPAAEALFIEKAEDTVRGTDAHLIRILPGLMIPRLAAVNPVAGNPYLPLFQAAFDRSLAEDPFLAFVHVAAMQLPVTHLTAVLEAAQSHCPNREVEARVIAMLTLLRQGETRRDIIRQAGSPR